MPTWKPTGADWLRAVATGDDTLLGEILMAVLPAIRLRVIYWADAQKKGH